MQDEGATDVFHALIKIKVGNMRRVYFWIDKWINGRKVEDIAPRILTAVPTCWKNCRTTEVALQTNRWMLDITGALTEVDCRQLVDLWMANNTLDRDANEEDQFSWVGGKLGKNSAKDTYTMLCHGCVRSSITTPIWRSLAPPKCKNLHLACE
jgi:hypothetical protein